MKILLVNTSECTGGAAVACGRLLDALNRHGVKAKMLVRDKQTDNLRVVSVEHKWLMKWYFLWERLLIWMANCFSRKHLFAVDIANAGIDITTLSEFQEADLIHLHWVNQGMLSLSGIEKILSSGKPVVWTMHDMWPCTAICHYAYTCEHFKHECGSCRFLANPGKHDLSYKVFQAKRKLFSGRKINIVAVSRWLAQQVKESTLLGDMPLKVLPNTLQLSDFPMLNKADARKQLGLTHKYVLLFGAARIDDPIKGIDLLLEAIVILQEKYGVRADDLHLMLFGGVKHPERLFPRISISYTHCGLIKDKLQLAQLYAAADVTVSASYYETFGQTLIEAQACGCIPVSFNNSGQTDIIRHKENGYLAEYLSTDDLAKGIRWGLEEAPTVVSREELRKDVATRFGTDTVAKQHIEFYQQILKKQ